MIKALLVIFILTVLAGAVWLVFFGDAAPPDGRSADSPDEASTPGVLVSSGGNIRVTAPQPNQVITVPVRIKGEARVFESTVISRISAGDGKVLAEDVTIARSPDVGQFGPFEFLLSYPEPPADAGLIEVFTTSAKDGSEIEKIRVPVRFSDAEAVSVQAFFIPSEGSPEAVSDCAQTVAVQRRVTSTPALAQAALEQLLQGPTLQERDRGLDTAINPGVRINSLAIEKGTARVDFSPELDQSVAGSCRVTAIRSQITDTLKQFPSVQDVTISVNGQTEIILQP